MKLHLPRAQWASHPRFPAQALLLDSHEAFRRRSQWLIDSLEHVAPATGVVVAKRRRWLARLRGDFDWWMTGMSGHERYEEHKLYPFLARKYGVSFDALRNGHKTLHVRRDEVRNAFRRALALHSDDDAFIEVLESLKAHRAFLLCHLTDEENLVIPLLLELTPEEFRYYYDTPSRQLLADDPESQG